MTQLLTSHTHYRVIKRLQALIHLKMPASNQECGHTEVSSELVDYAIWLVLNYSFLFDRDCKITATPRGTIQFFESREKPGTYSYSVIEVMSVGVVMQTTETIVTTTVSKRLDIGK